MRSQIALLRLASRLYLSDSLFDDYQPFPVRLAFTLQVSDHMNSCFEFVLPGPKIGAWGTLGWYNNKRSQSKWSDRPTQSPLAKLDPELNSIGGLPRKSPVPKLLANHPAEKGNSTN